MRICESLRGALALNNGKLKPFYRYGFEGKSVTEGLKICNKNCKYGALRHANLVNIKTA